MRSCLVVLVVMTACTEPTREPVARVGAPLSVALSHQPADHDLELLDLRADGMALWGRPGLAPPRATVLPRYDTWLVTADGRNIDLPRGGVVRDARFGPPDTGWLALLGTDDVLRLWSLGDGESIEVATDGFPGSSFSADGSALVYAAGARPELELYLFDIETRSSRQVTHLESPLALPAFTDGGDIVFASALGGVPALWLIDRDGSGLRQLTNCDITPDDFRAGVTGVPMPEGRRPPLSHGGAVVFEAMGGVFAVDATGALVWALGDADLPHRSSDGRLWLRTQGGARALGGVAP